MPTEVKKKPKPKMYGITTLDVEIPDVPDDEKPAKSMRATMPLPLAIYGGYLGISAAFFIICGFTLWGSPDEGIFAFMIDHSKFIFRELPGMFAGAEIASDMSRENALRIIPVAFCVAGLFSAAASYFVLTLNWRVRWGIMLVTGGTVCSIAKGMFLHDSFVNEAPLTSAQSTMLILNALLNAMIFLYFAVDPHVVKAFEEAE